MPDFASTTLSTSVWSRKKVLGWRDAAPPKPEDAFLTRPKLASRQTSLGECCKSQKKTQQQHNNTSLLIEELPPNSLNNKSQCYFNCL